MTSPITYTWGIAQLEAAPTDNDLTNVVKTIHWTLSAVHDDGFTASSYGSVSLESPEADSFVEYEDLTQQMVEGWLEAKLDGDTLRDNLATQIAREQDPPIVTPSLPWAN